MPEPEMKDPVGMRDPIKCVQAVEILMRGKRKFEGEDLKQLRLALTELSDALEALDLVIVVENDTDQLACQLLSIGQAFARGEASETDEQGFLKLGDTATELADQLYVYATEG